MRIIGIEVKNFKSFKDMKFGSYTGLNDKSSMLNLPPLCVFVGENGVGKTTLFDVFSFLKDFYKDDLETAITKRISFNEIISRGCDTKTDIISFIIRFLNLDDRKTTYVLEFGQDDNGLYINKESFSYRVGSGGTHFEYVNFSKGEGFIVEDTEIESVGIKPPKTSEQLGNPLLSALKGFSHLAKYKNIASFVKMIEDWSISDIHIDSSRKSAPNGSSLILNKNGDNLLEVAKNLKTKHKNIFDEVCRQMENIPGVESLDTTLQEDGTLLLKLKEKNFETAFISKSLSDGTLKMFAYLILLSSPHVHSFLSIEEPENQLYKDLLEILVAKINAYTKNKDKGQVFVSTHSPEFLNLIDDINSVFIIKKENGYSTITPLSDNIAVKSVFDGGDKLGYLWGQGAFFAPDKNND